jgi:hypothetical protein
MRFEHEHVHWIAGWTKPIGFRVQQRVGFLAEFALWHGVKPGLTKRLHKETVGLIRLPTDGDCIIEWLSRRKKLKQVNLGIARDLVGKRVRLNRL